MMIALAGLGIFLVLGFVAFLVVDIRTNRMNRELGELTLSVRAAVSDRQAQEQRIDALTKRANDQFGRITGLAKDHAVLKQYITYIAKNQASERVAHQLATAKVFEIYNTLLKKGTFQVLHLDKVAPASATRPRLSRKKRKS